MGDTLPSLEVHEGTPKNTVNVKELFTGKKGVLFGVPGAFTPSCSKVHSPVSGVVYVVRCGYIISIIDSPAKLCDKA